MTGMERRDRQAASNVDDRFPGWCFKLSGDKDMMNTVYREKMVRQGIVGESQCCGWLHLSGKKFFDTPPPRAYRDCPPKPIRAAAPASIDGQAQCGKLVSLRLIGL